MSRARNRSGGSISRRLAAGLFPAELVCFERPDGGRDALRQRGDAALCGDRTRRRQDTRRDHDPQLSPPAGAARADASDLRRRQRASGGQGHHAAVGHSGRCEQANAIGPSEACARSSTRRPPPRTRPRRATPKCRPPRRATTGISGVRRIRKLSGGQFSRRTPTSTSSLPACEDGSACAHPIPNVPQNRSCHEKRGSPRVYVIIRDGTAIVGNADLAVRAMGVLENRGIIKIELILAYLMVLPED